MESCSTSAWGLALSRRSGSQGAAQNLAREKIKKVRRLLSFPTGVLSLPLAALFFCTEPQLTERLEEATWGSLMALHFEVQD